MSTTTRATRREWVGLATIALPCMVYAMDLTVLNLAVPALSRELNPSSSQLLWIIDIYGFMVAGFLITMGTLGDRIGRRKLLLIGAAAFAAASAIAAFSKSAEMLIAMRALLGVAGATLGPSTLSLIRNMFHDERERQFAIGVWIASFSTGAAIGPLLGGVVIEAYSWEAVFLIAVPVMLALLVLGPVLLPEYRDPNAGRLDMPSVLLSLAAVLAGIYALKSLAEHGASWAAAACLAGAFTLGVVFLRRQRRIGYPLLDLSLFRSRAFSASIAAYGLSCLAMFGTYVFITQYLQLVLGLSPIAAGLATLPWALAFVAGSLLAPLVARKVGALSVLAWGLVVAAIGFLGLTLAGTPWGLPALVAGTVLMSLGLAPVFTIGNEMIVGAAPPERAGSASALAETTSEFGAALGIALFGSVGMVLYRAGLGASLTADVPADLANQALATMAGAISAADSIGGAQGAAIAMSAKSAFVDALKLCAVLGAAIVIGASALAAAILRGGLRSAPQSSPEERRGNLA